MSINDYHFITKWRVKGTSQEVSDIIRDVEALTRWWPSVYLGVNIIRPGNQGNGIGTLVQLDTKGWLPYTLKWNLCVIEAEYPKRITLKASGDFDGRGIWTFEDDKEFVDIVYDWKIRAHKPLLRYLSLLLKPVFSANHHWAMAKGLESLKLELQRRRAATSSEKSRVALPPGPTTTSKAPILGGTLALAGIVTGLMLFISRLIRSDEGIMDD
jgi:hypothetical protein